MPGTAELEIEDADLSVLNTSARDPGGCLPEDVFMPPRPLSGSCISESEGGEAASDPASGVLVLLLVNASVSNGGVLSPDSDETFLIVEESSVVK